MCLLALDAGMALPWDLTIECSRHTVKLDSISSSCRLSPAEELQVFDSDMVAKTIDCKAYSERYHHDYVLALCFNRQQQLKHYDSINQQGLVLHTTSGSDVHDSAVTQREVACRAPARQLTTHWPYYHDGTVFGETYQEMVDVGSVEDFDSWFDEVRGSNF